MIPFYLYVHICIKYDGLYDVTNADFSLSLFGNSAGSVGAANGRLRRIRSSTYSGICFGSASLHPSICQANEPASAFSNRLLRRRNAKIRQPLASCEGCRQEGLKAAFQTPMTSSHGIRRQLSECLGWSPNVAGPASPFRRFPRTDPDRNAIAEGAVAAVPPKACRYTFQSDLSRSHDYHRIYKDRLVRFPENCMTTQQLEKFFRKKAQRSRSVSSAKLRQRWLNAVRDLYIEIETKYLARLIKDKVVTVSRRPKTMFEESLGEYSVDDLIINVGDESAVFSPKGRLIVGAQGRVDLEGERAVVTLVLNPGRWSIVASRTPTLRLVPLSEQSLLEAVKDVMRA